MKDHRFFVSFTAIITSSFLVLSGCQRSSNAVWEDTKTVGRYLQRGSNKLLFRIDNDSKLIHEESEFAGPVEEEFIPLARKDAKTQQIEHSIPQAKDLQLTSSSSSPTIDLFKDPSYDLASIFRSVNFNTDDHVLRTAEHYQTIDKIADYLKKHPSLYVFVSGHTDQRASEAYNLALGLRRANFVRSLLIKKGIDPGQVYTISFGKEMPLDQSHTKEAWAKNRRAEFKLYDKNTLVKK